mgnify:CR=1 FL=1
MRVMRLVIAGAAGVPLIVADDCAVRCSAKKLEY